MHRKSNAAEQNRLPSDYTKRKIDKIKNHEPFTETLADYDTKSGNEIENNNSNNETQNNDTTTIQDKKTSQNSTSNNDLSTNNQKQRFRVEPSHQPKPKITYSDSISNENIHENNKGLTA